MSRPLSPHLQIYRLPLEALTSIAHRLSGVALSLGACVLVGWLWALANSENCFNNLQKAFASPLGRLCLFGWSLAFFYHLCAGVRHLIWDTGMALDKKSYRLSSYIVIGAALILTIGVWVYIWPRIGT
jgi:succinate dehydrogenase / fumarate reductase cytochrome b subunit